ncbi:hypothetical protein SAPIO_CDS2553 [Scedosporium apiospermum]|uniref:DUF7791 domain-containing protein n=1 Tax=Pseudallescheria apiosperma TaxID=563466 RepID=A0A084GCQ7_PSEDA|nr:uncharacterized protein SAPIO_CDS2553 [Scedosporium apiospermum]KEZ45119.1 hypothetical protein SAPIO_CDS2553 [Scedosporium apiospermum]
MTELPRSELIQIFRILVEEDTSAKYFFLFDGLDEFEGDKSALVTLVHTLGSHANVKICVSSRPWNVFEDAFRRQPSLMLERLTFNDIALYVHGTLTTHPAFRELSYGNPEYAAELVRSITTKASGVFLWVVLTVRSLLEGLADGDPAADLQARLREIPDELEELFGKILHGLKGRYFNDAARLFKIYQAAGEIPLTVLTLSFADEAEVESVLSQSIRPLTAKERFLRATSMKRRLNSRCKGLLEIQYPQNEQHSAAGLLDQRDIDHLLSTSALGPKSTSDLENYAQALGDLTIQYLHRTVKDYLESSDVSRIIQSACSNATLTPQVSLCLGQILRLKTFEACDNSRSLYLDRHWD